MGLILKTFTLIVLGLSSALGWVMAMHYCAVRVWVWNGSPKLTISDLPFWIMGALGLVILGLWLFRSLDHIESAESAS